MTRIKYEDIWFNVEYDYRSGCQGTLDVPESPPSVKLWAVYIDKQDLLDLLSSYTIEQMENQILEENYGV